MNSLDSHHEGILLHSMLFFLDSQLQFGTSCSGQCSALGASLCPSGACSDCEIDLDTATRSLATLTSNNLGHCAFGWPRAGCNVRDQPMCCYHPTCRQNKESCCRKVPDFLRVGNSHCGPGRRPGSGSGTAGAGVGKAFHSKIVSSWVPSPFQCI